MSKRRKGAGSIYKQKNCRTWTIKYYKGGKCYREATGLKDFQAARQKLNQKLAKIADGSFTPPQLDRVAVAELMPPYFRQQRVDGCKDVHRGEKRWEQHLQPFFGGLPASKVTGDVLNQYAEKRLEAGAAQATINRELSVLSGAFHLAAQETALRVPRFPHLKEDNVRTGFVDDAQYARLAQNTSELYLRAILEMGYEYGWRKSELLGLRVRHVDINARTVSLDVGSTKNREGRLVVMTSVVHALLAQCIVGKQPDDYVFTRADGSPVRNITRPWTRLTKTAGLPNLLFHDMRRSAVRNMLRSGVDEKTAMTISGHKTRKVFDRYHIVSQSDLVEAARKSEARRADSYGHDSGHDAIEIDALPREKVQ